MGKKNKDKACCGRNEFPPYIVGGTDDYAMCDMLECKNEQEAVEEAKLRVRDECAVTLVYKLVKIVTQAEPTVEDIK